LRVAIGSGNPGLDTRLAEAFRAKEHEAETFAYGEALVQKPGDAAVVGASLPVDDKVGVLGVLVYLRREGARVIYLPGRRDQDDAGRERLLQAVALGVYDVLFDEELDPAAVVAVLDNAPSFKKAVSVLRRPGEPHLSSGRLGSALQKALDHAAAEQPEPEKPAARPLRVPRPPREPRPAKEPRPPREAPPAKEPAEPRRVVLPVKKTLGDLPQIEFRPGVTSFIGAVPGCGCTRLAISYARAGDGDVLLVDAHLQRAHMAYYLLGRHLSLLLREDVSWRHCRGKYRDAVREISTHLQFLPLAFEPVNPGLRAANSAFDAAIRWGASGADVEVNARPGGVLEEVRPLLDYLAGRSLTSVAVNGGALPAADRELWSQTLGVSVLPKTPRVTSSAARLVADLDAALGMTGNAGVSPVVDFGSPDPLVAGLADPRVSWAAHHGHVVVVTRPDAIGREAAARMLKTILSENPEASAEITGGGST